MEIKKIYDRNIFCFLLIVFILSGCNPALYKKPAEDFQIASTALKDSYFLEFDISNRAFIQKGDLADQIQIWGAPQGISQSELNRISKRMSKRKQRDVHEQIRPLREQAFKVLDAYASTLVSLSSKEPTEQIQTELGGLVKDITATIITAEKLSLAGESLSNLKKFTGPLEQYVGVLNEIIGLISNVIRERAIIETIGKSNESILELLGILKMEAAAAEKNALTQIDAAKSDINQFMSHNKFKDADNNIKANIVKKKAELDAIEQEVKNHDLASAFTAAIKAQGGLVKKAMLSEPGDWVLRIKDFKEHIIATKAAIEKTRSEM